VKKNRTARRDFEGPSVGARRAAVEANRRNGLEPAICDRCGAVLLNRTWRARRVTSALLARASWRTCPACRQFAGGEYFGRVSIRGGFVGPNEAAIRRRVRNVEQRARFTQPERRLVAADRERSGLEVLTTSQRLAHRIVKELKKAFRGRASYHWDERDGSLYAVWQRDH
jgi:NMD protein affecting ribosome stability and mRNA decay